MTVCEKYDVSQAIWKEIKSVAKPRSKFTAACTIDGMILIMGGKFMVFLNNFITYNKKDGTRTDIIEKYNPSTNEWLPFGAKLTKSKSSFAAISMPGII